MALPLRLQPRLDPKPWGGRQLERFGFPLPPHEPIGEALATAGEARIADGPLAGQTLASMVESDPERIIGARGLAATGGRPLFPLLIKLIDAEQDLSIQLHPHDAAAAPLGRLGKTEAWHVLAAAPGALVALGLRPGVTIEEFAAACRTGRRTAPQLRWLPAVPGTTMLIPAGTVHALGAGCLVYEVQQPSDITYRLDDWGRLDAAGRPRELHVEVGLAVLKSTLRPEPISPVAVASAIGRRQLLTACRLFALERIALPAGAEVQVQADGSPQVVTCVRGAIALTAEGGTTLLATGESGVVTADAQAARVLAHAPAVVLRAWVPNLRSEIVDLARTTGHADQSIAALAGPLPDIDEVLVVPQSNTDWTP